LATPKRASSAVLTLPQQLAARQAPGRAALGHADFGRRHEAVVGGQHHQVVVFADGGVQLLEEGLQHAVELQQVVVRQARLGAEGVVHVVVARQADLRMSGASSRPSCSPAMAARANSSDSASANGLFSSPAVEGRLGAASPGLAHAHRQSAAAGPNQGWPSGTERA
jgi:hypothetical protein